MQHVFESGELISCFTIVMFNVLASVMLSPRGQKRQNFGLGLGLEALFSASAWPRSRYLIM